MGNYEDAIRDLDVAKIMEASVGGKKQIESETKIVLDQQNSVASPSKQHNQNNSNKLGKITSQQLLLIIKLCNCTWLSGLWD